MWKGGFDGIGRALPEYRDWLKAQPRPTWCKGITVHNTGVPGLRRAREIGLPTYVRNAGAFFKAPRPKGRGWSAGPHAFVGEDRKVYGGTPVHLQGVHDPCHNADHLAPEMMMNADGKEDDDDAGPGLAVKETCAELVAVWLDWLNLPLSNATVTFHKECKRTTHDCPGRDIDKAEFMARVAGYMAAPPRLTVPVQVAPPLTLITPPLSSEGEHDPHLVPEIGNPTTFDVREGPGYVFAPPSAEELADRPRWAVRLLCNLKWSRAAAIGLVGGWQEEAYKDLRTGAVGDHHSPGGSIGIMQVNRDRKDAFIKFAEARGKPITDFETNILFANWELEHGEISAGKNLAAALTIWSAAIAAIGYERPAGWSALTPTRPPSFRRRLDNAIALDARLPK